MRIAVLGISGYQGHYFVRETIDRGHTLIGVARHASTVKDYYYNDFIKYDASGSDYAEMKKIFKEEKVDKVISVYPPDVLHPWTFPSDMKSLIKACKDSGVKQLLMMMGGSANYSRWGNDINPHDIPSFGQQVTVGTSYYKYIYDARVEAFDTEKELDWVIFTPNHLIKYGERSGKYIYNLDGHGIMYDEHSLNMKDAGAINYWDFACAMLDTAENPNPKFTHKIVSLAWSKEYADEITKKIPVMVNK